MGKRGSTTALARRAQHRAKRAQSPSRLNQPIAQAHGTYVSHHDTWHGGKDAIEKSVWLYACVLRVAGLLASVRPLVVETGTDDKEATGPDADYLKRMMDCANQEQTWFDFAEQGIVHLALDNEIIVEKARGLMKAPMGGVREVSGLYHWDPVVTQVIPDQTGARSIAGFEYVMGNGQRVQLAWKDAIWTRTPHPRERYRGISGIKPMDNELRADFEAAKHNFWRIRNGVRTGGVFTPAEGWDMEQDQARQWMEFVNSNHAGPRNAGRTVMFPWPGKFTPDGASLRDMDYPGMRKFAREVVAAAIGAPPIVIGDFDAATYANSYAQLKTFFSFRGIPLLEKLFGALNEHWVHREVSPRLSLRPDIARIKPLIEDPEVETERARGMFLSGIITQNEARKISGHAPTEQGDFFCVPVNVQVLKADEDPREALREPEPEMGAPVGAEQQPEDPQQSRAPAFVQGKRLTPAQRQLARLEHERQLVVAEKRIIPVAKSFLLDEERRVIQALDENPNAIADDIFDTNGMASRGFDALAPVLLDVIRESGEDQLRRTGSVSLGCDHWRVKNDEDDEIRAIVGSFGLNNPEVQQYIEVYFGENIQRMASETLRELRLQLEIAHANGEGVSQIFNRLRNQAFSFSEERAEKIARTESNAATNLGSFEAFRKIGVARKSWLSSRDTGVRQAHISADAQYTNRPIPISDYFVLRDIARNAETRARYPGDPQSAAWNVVNCRCGLQPEDEDVRAVWLESLGEAR